MTTAPPPAHDADATTPVTTVRLLIGAVAALAGLLLLLLPDRTLLLVGFLIGTQLVLVGVLRIWALRAFVLPANVRAAGYALAVLTIVAGILCMVRPGTSLLVVAIVVGVGWLADGAAELVAFARNTAADRGFALMSGILTLLGGLAVLFFPRTSLVALAQVAGVFLLLFGIAHLVTAFRRREA